ncbi:MAG TPA: hypothetical protein VMV29_07265 [Ktedonobacterales bacterium]|nr:hypothetical protein [Ktedonobacterales bacterium]
MALPVLRTDGSLPPGLHPITSVSELSAAFPPITAQRQTLDAELTRFVDVVKRFGLGTEVALDGSYITGKVAPSDLDLALYAPGLSEYDVEQRLLAEGADLARSLDLWIETDRAQYEKWVRFFSTDRNGDPRGVIILAV